MKLHRQRNTWYSFLMRFDKSSEVLKCASEESSGSNTCSTLLTYACLSSTAFRAAMAYDDQEQIFYHKSTKTDARVMRYKNYVLEYLFLRNASDELI